MSGIKRAERFLNNALGETRKAEEALLAIKDSLANDSEVDPDDGEQLADYVVRTPTFPVEKPIVITPDNQFTLKKGRYVQGEDFNPNTAVIYLKAEGRKQLWGAELKGIEVVGNSYSRNVDGIYVLGAVRTDLDVKVVQCTGAGVNIDGWNIVGKVHSVNNAAGVCISGKFATYYAEVKSKEDMKEYLKYCPNIIRLYQSHIERCNILIQSLTECNDFWYEGVLHGYTPAEREKKNLADYPLVDLRNLSGISRIEGQLTWSLPEHPSILIGDLGRQLYIQRPLNMKIDLLCSEWTPYREGLIDTSEVFHPKSNVVQNIQYYK